MALTFNPLAPWHWLVTTCAALVVIGLWLRFIFSTPSVRAELFGRQGWKSLLVALFTTLAVLAISLAAWNPVTLIINAGVQPHLAIILDSSESTIKGAGNLEQLKNKLLPWLDQTLAVMPEAISKDASAGLIVVATSASEQDASLSIPALPAAIQKLTLSKLPVGSATDLEAGLKMAHEQINLAGGQGTVLLVSDGNQTSGNALEAAKRLAKAGIPIHVLPVAGGSSAVYLAAADLPVQVLAEETTYLRGVIWNRLNSDAPIDIEVKVNSGSQEPGSRAEKIVFQKSTLLPAGSWSNLNVPLTFTGAGLQYVDIRLNNSAASPADVIRRRFYIYVLVPPRILAIGGDNRWVGGFTPDELIIDQAEASQLPATTIFEEYDAVVINKVEESSFVNGLLDGLANAIKQDGVGLFFINGAHAPRKEEDPSTFSGYAGSALEPLLPVSVRPREETQEPPARNVIFLMDVSGSMEGEKLNLSKRIATYLVQKYLRPQDRLDVITFTTDAQHVVQSLGMTAEGKLQAANRIDSLPVGGGTDPSMALKIISGLKVNNCGLIFLTDGEFMPVSVRPECRATIFDIGQDTIDPNFPLDFADPIPAPLNYSPANIEIPYFKPDIRKKFFEEGNFKALRTTNANPLAASLAFPENLILEGAAVTYIKAEAELIAVRPKLTDPVLAFMTTEEGTVGAFTSEISPNWFNDTAGHTALRDWVMQTVAYNARDRYIFQVTDLGKNVRLCVSVVSKDPAPVQISGLDLALRQGGKLFSVPMSAEATPGQFCGIAQLPDRPSAEKGTLILGENGLNALQKKQRIPIMIPASGSMDLALASEAYSYGVNESLLRAIADESHGVYNPPSGMTLFAPRTEQTRANPLWPWLLFAGSLLYLAAIYTRRFND